MDLALQPFSLLTLYDSLNLVDIALNQIFQRFQVLTVLLYIAFHLIWEIFSWFSGLILYEIHCQALSVHFEGDLHGLILLSNAAPTPLL